MKSSLIWRFVLIFALTILWTVSMFPLKDRDFFETFRKLADKQLRKYEQAGDTEKTKGFDAMMAEAEATLKASPSMAPGTAIRDAAKGTVTRKRVVLHEYIPVPTQPKASNALVLSRVRTAAAGKLRLGLDLRGGTEFVISFNKDELPEGRPVESVRDQIIEILRNRVDKQGIAEPELKPIGPNSISLRMPSVTESDKADVRRTIKQPAQLEFRIVDPNNDQKVAEYGRDPKRFRPSPGYEYFEMEVDKDGGTENEVLFLKSRPEAVKGEQVTRAVATFNEYGNYAISMSFNSAGAAAFARVTTENVGQRMAIVLDGKVYSAPVIREAITQGSAEITGSFSPEEAQRLAGVIESGNLPVSIQIDSEFGTDPTLGSDSIKSGLSASFWGMGLVVVFMIAYYRLAGVIAVIALTLNMLLIVGTMTISRATFTLPGIAGMILTIGMAVDANVLIYERMREEIRNGKTIGNVIKAGYSRAFWAIFDSNLTTVLTAMVLYWYGTGPVRGFAVTLIIGLIASMFTALVVTRAIFDLLLYLDKIKTINMMQLMKQPNYDYLKYRNVWVGISIACVVVSLGCGVVRGKSGLSIDFVGGMQLAYRCEASQGDPDIGVVRDILEKKGYSDCRVGYKFAATEGHRLLELVLPARSTDEAGFDETSITKALTDGVPGTKFTLMQTVSIGGLVGAQFQMQAVIALVLASLMCILYLAFRFEFAYGVAAVVAVLHDVIIAAGVFLLCGRLMSLTTLAALLTIMGFSLNDTIVIFDRVREDLGLHKDKSYVQIINQAVNETMSRTILTSLTVWIVVWTLFLFGGGAINDFALIMLVGVVVGTYSTVFIASAIVAAWHKRQRLADVA